MSKRPAITERMRLDAVFHIAFINGSVLCPLCKTPITPGSYLEWDHAIPLALGGEHTYANIRPMHGACHRTKTSGTKATSAGSDIHKIAKVKRIVRTQKMAMRKTIPGTYLTNEGDLYRIDKNNVWTRVEPKRKWPSRPMQSRPFQRKERP